LRSEYPERNQHHERADRNRRRRRLDVRAALTLRSHMLPVFARRARSLGVRVDDFDIDPDAEEVTVTCARAREIGDAIAERTKDPLFGFHAAQGMPRGAYGLIEYVVRNTPTVRALIHQ